MEDQNLQFRLIRGFNHFGIDMLIRGEDYVAKPLVFERAEQHVYIEKTCSITDDSAQQLMDELWRIGVRPSNGEGNVGQIGAMKDHLEDMRKIAFAELEIKKG